MPWVSPPELGACGWPRPRKSWPRSERREPRSPPRPLPRDWAQGPQPTPLRAGPARQPQTGAGRFGRPGAPRQRAGRDHRTEARCPGSRRPSSGRAGGHDRGSPGRDRSVVNPDLLLAHYHEIGLKGRNRPRFERALRDNLKRALGDSAARVRLVSGRVEITEPKPDALGLAARARGVRVATTEEVLAEIGAS